MSNRLHRWFADLALSRKLMFMTMGIVLAASLTTLGFMHYQSQRSRSDQFVQRGLKAAALVADYAAAPLVFEDEPGAKDLLATFATGSHLTYVRLEDAKGRVFAKVGNDAGAPVLTIEKPFFLGAETLHVVAPVVQKGRIGILRAGFDLDELEEALDKEHRFLFLVLAGVIVVSYILARWLQRLIAAPLLALESHARQVAETQDFSKQLEPPGHDEVGNLYRGFNHLLERIRQNQEDILALNRSLESKVIERTRDLEAARDRADRASLSKSEFLANMSHEIRTPINAVTGFTTLMLRTPLDPRQAEYLERIHTAAQGLLHIVNDLLDFSKIEAGKMTLEHTPFRLAEVIETMVAYVGTLAERKGLELLVHVAPDVPLRLVGDPMRLGQVLINLTNNAVKFTARGEVDVSATVVSRDGAQVRLRFAVRDTGIGLTEEQASKLFQAFQQADTSTTRKFGGTGLGLVISKRIVTMMNGDIRLESKPNVGTTFYFEVDLQAAPSQEDIGASLPSKMRGVRALVVDDNLAARQILVGQLEQLGFAALAVSSGQAAIGELRRASTEGQPYPVVLMDWKMPDMDGIGATRAIRADPAIARTPVVIMVTAFGREQALAAPENASILDGVLLKPVTPGLLADALARLLEGDEESRRKALDVPMPHREKLTGVRVLLVEDNPVNQQLAEELLRQDGADVRIAANGRVALEILHEAGLSAFDVALVDLQMPEMDGYETTRHVRQMDDGAQLPIIALTAHALTEERERCLAAGMNDHVSKPIDPDLLVQKVALWVGADGMARAAARGVKAPVREKPPAPSGTLPESIAGLDIETALRRCGGNASLYRELLVKFRARYGRAADDLRHQLDIGAHADARFLAHGVKGAAANLGATEVARSAAAIEDALRDGNEASGLVGDLARALAEIEPGIAQLAPSAGEKKTAADDAEVPAELRTVVDDLLGCLRNSDMRSEALVEELAAHWPGGAPKWVSQAASAIHELDYEAALERVEHGVTPK